jgi:hypothetical protein
MMENMVVSPSTMELSESRCRVISLDGAFLWASCVLQALLVLGLLQQQVQVFCIWV